jgi:protein TonB
MYGAMRERAPSSTRIAGLSAALLVTAAVGYALANGFLGQVAKFIEPTLTFTPIEEETPVVVEKQKVFNVDVDASSTPVDIPIPDNKFTVDDDRETITIPPGGPEPRLGGGEAVGGTGAKASPIRTRPALITRTPPPYPAADVRKQNEGVTGLKVCVDAAGRVTSAKVASSSGHVSLDSAALKWVRTTRFTPAKADGAAEAVCGHDVLYEWKIENAR